MNVSHMIERLEDAIQVCYDVGKDKTKVILMRLVMHGLQ